VVGQSLFLLLAELSECLFVNLLMYIVTCVAVTDDLLLLGVMAPHSAAVNCCICSFITH